MKKITYLTYMTVCLALIVSCHARPDGQTAGMDTELVLFDFNGGSAGSEWKSVNDTVMGGVSNSRMTTSDAGHALFTGNVSLENNGGFASVRGPNFSHRLGEYRGIAVRVRGDGKTYKAGLRTDELFDGVFHQAGFSTIKGEWQEIQIPFTDFIPTYHGRRLSEDKRMAPDEVRSVSLLISDKQAGPFQLEIDWIKAYR